VIPPYQALDWLLARQAPIEKKLAERHLHGGSEVLYDISSSYYEGRCCSLVRYGHNRDDKRETAEAKSKPAPWKTTRVRQPKPRRPGAVRAGMERG
jgi:hypothetical protein